MAGGELDGAAPRRPGAAHLERDVLVVTRDGTELATDVHRPDDGRPRPCLLQRVAYGKGASAIADGALEVARAVERGYAVVVQDCRGRGRSGGRFEPFAHDADDAIDTIDWIVGQPWCDGAVGLFGRSYSAMAQWQVAERRPAAVRAMAPMLSGADVASGWLAPGGVLEWGFVLLWCARHLAPDAVARAARRGEPFAAEALADVDALLRDLPPPARAELAAAVPFVEAALALDGVAPRPPPPPSAVPALVIAGWYDIFLRGALETATRLAATEGAAPVQLVVGPWAHGGTCPGAFPEHDHGVGASAAAVGLTDLQLDWFDRWLRPAVTAVGPAAKVFVTGVDEWRDEPHWPPAGTAEQVLHLGAPVVAGDDGALLGWLPPPAEVEVAYDEADPVPTVGGQTFLPGLEVAANAGPRSQDGLRHRPDVAWFVGTVPTAGEAGSDDARGSTTTSRSPVMPAAAGAGCVELAGEVRASIRLAGAAPGTRVCVRLADVGPGGRALLLAEGAGRVAVPTTRPAPGAGVAAAAVGAAAGPGPVGAVGTAEVVVGWVAHVLRAGHQLALLVSATSWPRFARPVAPLPELAGPVSERAEVGRLVLRCGPGGSHLVLPVRT